MRIPEYLLKPLDEILFYYAKGAMMSENKVETIENRVPSNIRYRTIPSHY